MNKERGDQYRDIDGIEYVVEEKVPKIARANELTQFSNAHRREAEKDG